MLMFINKIYNNGINILIYIVKWLLFSKEKCVASIELLV